jgi:hypothetical protein
MSRNVLTLSPKQARAIWLRAQRLDEVEPFGSGPQAALAAVEHLGYVQIDTINVVERCHHHILFTRIPGYRRAHLAQLQSTDKTVFEYWTHALSYVPVTDFSYFLPAMKRSRDINDTWFGKVTPAEITAMTRRLKREGPLSIRDIADDELVEKHHPWASRKPSKRVLQLMFYQGLVVVSARQGMVKTYDLTARHFGWERMPRPATERQVTTYKLNRALRSQGVVSLDSICHLEPSAKPSVLALIESRVRRRQLVEVALEGAPRVKLWATPAAVAEMPDPPASDLVHLLSPFDPLIIQRRRLKLFFGYEHLFEAYVPASKRKLGYFALPVLMGDRVVAAVDLKADRAQRRLLVNKLSWLVEPGASEKDALDFALDRFASFQFGE